MPDEIRPVTPDAEARAALIEKMRKQSVAIYTAVEESVADDIAGTLRQAADLLAAEGTTSKRYSELLFEVQRKFDHETRHETALRYIREAEANAVLGPASTLPSPPGGGR